MHACEGLSVFKALMVGFSVGFMLAYAFFEIARVRRIRMEKKEGHTNA